MKIIILINLRNIILVNQYIYQKWIIIGKKQNKCTHSYSKNLKCQINYFRSLHLNTYLTSLLRPQDKQVIKMNQISGYCQELYDKYELVSDYYDTKEKKLIFLEKIIDFTQKVLNEKIIAQPQNIIIGQESDNTNIMLQAIFRAAVKDIAQGKQVAYQHIQMQNTFLQNRKQELSEHIQNLEPLINSEQFQQIFNETLYQKWKNELNQTKEQLKQNNIHLNFVQEKIDSYKKIQSLIIEFININNE
ncbi:hypothetical protein pb186bvf_006381 [Paramecium bursaria]